MAKRIIICADGTWSREDQHDATNVVKMARAVPPSSPDGKCQVVFYDAGVGTGNLLDRISGGAFGGGLDKNIADGYHFLIHNYDEGDEIYLFGFSRGAYTVRSLAGLIRKVGLLQRVHADRFEDAYKIYRKRDPTPDTDEAQVFKKDFSREVNIKFLGVWDTVGALGIPLSPLRFLTRGRYAFHDVGLSRLVEHGYQALAIDEKRRPFAPTLWEGEPKPGQVVEQVWFAGVHTDIGGGNPETDLSDIAFLWMMGKAEECGLALDEEYLRQITKPDPDGRLHNSMTIFYWLLRPMTRHLGGKGLNECLHPAVLTRYNNAALKYHPKNVAEYLSNPGHCVADKPASLV